MSDSQQLPPRPEPPRRLRETAVAWLVWFGVGRLVLAAISVAVVVIGVTWLVRAPAPPTEAALPFAGVSGPSNGVPASTLPPPPTSLVAATPASQPERVIVHVAGEVVRAGVYELPFDARVNAAVDAAGGPRVGADLNGLNLAAPLVDGQRVYVPAHGEVDPATVPSGPVVKPLPAESAGTPSGPIDLNTATAALLETLPGIGPATATAIVGDRDRNGPFAAVSDLERVPGIGPAKMAAIVDLVTV